MTTVSRRIEDFDENCDPSNPYKIKLEDVISAAKIIKPYISRTPTVPSFYQKKFAIHLYYKLESLQHCGSFKERGLTYALEKLPLDKKKTGIVLATLGNAGDAAIHSCRRLNIPVYIVIPTSVPISRLQRAFALGAKVIVQGMTLQESQKYARAIARDRGLTYINGRDHPDLLTGFGSVALEILEEVPNVDAILLPIGTGGLAAGVATVVKQKKPNCLVFGVQPEAACAFYKTLEETRDAMAVVNDPTMADNLNVTAVGINAFANAQYLLDKVVLVKEPMIARAILHFYEKERLVVEGAGACPLAAIMSKQVPELKMKTVVAIVTGGNVEPFTYCRCLERGLSAEGLLVRFKVNVRHTTVAQNQLLQLLKEGGWVVFDEMQTHCWLAKDEYWLEMTLCCRTRNLDHALELKRTMEITYPGHVQFDTEPFNDKRTCPCYTFKDRCAL